LALDNPPPFFKTHRSIINNKSELGIRAESFSPELSSPLEMNSARVKQPGKSSKGRNALQNLTTGVGNTAAGWHSLFANTAGNLNTAIGAGRSFLTRETTIRPLAHWRF
jgi:hypothetical protein